MLTAVPSAVGHHAATQAFGVMFGLGGLAGLLATSTTDGLVWLLFVDEVVVSSCLVLALVLLTWGRRLPRWSLAVPLLSSLVMITAVVHLAPSDTTAISFSMLYVMVVSGAFFLLSLLAASAHLVLAAVALVWAVQRSGSMDPLSVSVVLGVLLTAALLTGWLARAAATAEIDHLTGLLNRRGLQRRADDVMARRRGDQAPVVAVVIDLDHFKTVNDSIGHEGGDALLRDVGRALRAALPASALAGRWGGDEFVVLLPDVAAAAAREVVDRVRAGLPEGRSLSAGLAEGVGGDGLLGLLHRADAALYRAKRHARGSTRVHGHEGLGAGWVREAASAGQLEVFFQPIVDLEDDDVIGAEALVRWRHPDRGLLAPDAFLDEAVADGSIVDLDAWVLALACHESAAWARRADGSRRSLGVNVSG